MTAVAGSRRARPARPVRGRLQAPARPIEERRTAGERELDAWQLRMRSEGKSERTVVERRRVVEATARRVDLLPAELTTEALVGDLAALPSVGTRATYFAALKAWHRWLVELAEVRADNPMAKLRAPKVPRRRPRPITTAERDRALARITHARTRAYLLLAAYQGLRVHEVAAVRGEHVDVEGGRLRVIGKGRVDVHLPLHPAVAGLAPSFPVAGWWFPARDDPDRHVTAKNVSTVLAQALRRAGVRASAHQLRHWFGTEVLRSAGGNTRVAQELLRHADANTTAGYTEVDDRDRMAALVALPGAADPTSVVPGTSGTSAVTQPPSVTSRNHPATHRGEQP